MYGCPRARLVRVVALLGCALSLASCSILLDWSGYTGGDTGDGAAAAGGSDGAGDAHPPSCDGLSCGGCCESTGCAAGLSARSCGHGGQACQDCASQSLECSGGMCVSPPEESGPAPCSLIGCKTLITCLSTIDIACCKPDGTCGCQSILGASGCM